MRTLIIGGWALLLLAMAAPALTNYHSRSYEADHNVKIRSALPLTSLRALYTAHDRGSSFRRFHPEHSEYDNRPLFIRTIAAHAFPADTSLNGQWFLQPVLASDTAAGIFPSLNFSLRNKKFSGNTGCNTISGSFSLTDSTIQFNDNARVSRKICTGYNEAAFLKNLFRANRYTIVDSVMTLWFDQTELSRWTRKPQKKMLIKSA